MVMDYVGTVNTYLALPIFAAFGVTVTSVRLLPIVLAALDSVAGLQVGAAPVRLAGGGADRSAGRCRPVLPVLQPHGHPCHLGDERLCAGQPAGVSETGATSGRMRWLALGGLLLGLGLWAKVLFLWWIAALVVAFCVERFARSARLWSATTPVVANGRRRRSARTAGRLRRTPYPLRSRATARLAADCWLAQRRCGCIT